MTIRVNAPTTPAPQPGQIFMAGTSPADAAPTPAAPTATPTPLPDRTRKDSSSTSSGPETKPSAPPTSFPQPKLRLEVRDVLHKGAHRFLSAVDASTAFPEAVSNVQRILYSTPGDPTTHMPPTRSVTLILRDYEGVAYTTGTELDDDHKEIHLSARYVAGVQPPSRVREEVVGVLTHELVHAYQWDARGTCPGGLIEGVADFVRLRCGLGPPHWRRDPAGGGKGWDGGYEHTAYFLDYLEGRFGDGTVRRINEALRGRKYEEKPFWTGLLGRPVEQLWGDYLEHCRKKDG